MSADVWDALRACMRQRDAARADADRLAAHGDAVAHGLRLYERNAANIEFLLSACRTFTAALDVTGYTTEERGRVARAALTDFGLGEVFDRRDAAERRIAAALACHYRQNDHDCRCGHRWDTTLDRCTSPTVAALTAES